MESVSVSDTAAAEKIKQKVVSYWTGRAESFSDIRHEEAHSYKAALWQEELSRNLPAGGPLKILDVGCGTGFFELILAPFGHSITGIDLTGEMLKEGRHLLAEHDVRNARLLLMDAEKLTFPDACFDAVISRNLTWTLPNPARAYGEWYRVLRPGGVLLNYDAEYAKGFHTYDQAQNLAHKDLKKDMIEECHAIYHMLPVSAAERPAWDKRTLLETCFSAVECDLTAGDRLYGIKDRFYMPDRMFAVRAVK